MHPKPELSSFITGIPYTLVQLPYTPVIALHHSNKIDTPDNVLNHFSGIIRHGMESRIFLASAGRPKLAFQQSFHLTDSDVWYPVQGPLCCMSTASQVAFSATDMAIRKQSRLSPQLAVPEACLSGHLLVSLPTCMTGASGHFSGVQRSAAKYRVCQHWLALALCGMV